MDDKVRLDIPVIEEGWTQEEYELIVIFKDHNDIPVKATPANRVEIDPHELIKNYALYRITIMPYKEWIENECFDNATRDIR
jgi:hypothetical protein